MARARKNGARDGSQTENRTEETPETDDDNDEEGAMADDEEGSDDRGSGPGTGPAHHFGQQPGRTGPGRSARTLPGKMSRSQALKRTGYTKGKLERLVAENKLSPPEKDSDGRWWFSIEEIEELVEDAASDEMGAQQVIVATGKIIEQQGQACGRIIDQQMAHNDELAKTMAKMIEETGKRETGFMGAFLQATQQILTLQTEWSTKALERAAKLEAELDSARETIQMAINLEQGREVALAEAQMRKDRNDKIVGSLMPHLPTALALVAKKMGVSAEVATDPLVKDLMASVTQEQATALYQSGILSQVQLGQLLGIWEAMKKPEEPKKVEATVEGSNGEKKAEVVAS